MKDPGIPPPKAPPAYAIEMVCTGNICRSATAQVVLSETLAELGHHQISVTSSGTGDWHAGQAMDQRSAAALTAAGFDPSGHRARQVDPAALSAYDLTLAMDHSHLDELLRMGADPQRTLLFRTFDPVDPGGEVPDPYYGGPEGFEEVLTMVRRTSEEIARMIARMLG